MSDLALDIRSISKRFADHVAVTDLSLQVPRGSVYGLLGPNGAGKTTTIRMVLHVIAPDTGTITVLGRPSRESGALDRVGYLPEERGLYKKMSVRDVLRFLAELKGVKRKVADARIDTWLDRLQLRTEAKDWAKQAGTFWYHSHQVSHEQVQRGLLGPLVITPRAPAQNAPADITALAHVYAGYATINGFESDRPVPLAPGAAARVRVINSNNGAIGVWVQGAHYRVLAVDGYDLHEPAAITDRRVQVPAGGRVDLEVIAPTDGSAVRVEVGGPALLLGGRSASSMRPGIMPSRALDLLSYGTPATLPFNPESANRRFRYDIGRRPGFVHGRPGIWWSVNGHLYPDVPMFVVDEGDVVRMTIRNHSGRTHPMHLHGHHAVVLSRNGVAATGSPWWVDSLEIGSGDEYEIAFVADNPGIWMDHCHNLPHAQQGLVAHLMYSGVTEPYRLGRDTPNQPE